MASARFEWANQASTTPAAAARQPAGRRLGGAAAAVQGMGLRRRADLASAASRTPPPVSPATLRVRRGRGRCRRRTASRWCRVLTARRDRATAQPTLSPQPRTSPQHHRPPRRNSSERSAPPHHALPTPRASSPQPSSPPPNEQRRADRACWWRHRQSRRRPRARVSIRIAPTIYSRRLHRRATRREWSVSVTAISWVPPVCALSSSLLLPGTRDAAHGAMCTTTRHTHVNARAHVHVNVRGHGHWHVRSHGHWRVRRTHPPSLHSHCHSHTRLSLPPCTPPACPFSFAPQVCSGRSPTLSARHRRMRGPFARPRHGHCAPLPTVPAHPASDDGPRQERV